ncbi:hypothetical protein ACFL4N_08150 [Thermodesulfobacteriota bacterium]
MKFRFKKFRVYQDAKEYSKGARGSVDEHIRRKDRNLADQIQLKNPVK